MVQGVYPPPSLSGPATNQNHFFMYVSPNYIIRKQKETDLEPVGQLSLGLGRLHLLVVGSLDR